MTGEEYYKLWRERHMWRPRGWSHLLRTEQSDWILAAENEDLCLDQIPYGYDLRRWDEAPGSNVLTTDLIGLLDG